MTYPYYTTGNPCSVSQYYTSCQHIKMNLGIVIATTGVLMASLQTITPINGIGYELDINNRDVIENSVISLNDIAYTNGIANIVGDNVILNDAKRNESIKILKEIQQLQKNWNGNNAEPFSQDIISEANKLIMLLNFQPSIYPTANDSIQFEFENSNDDYLELELFEGGRLKMFIMRADESCDNRDIDINTVNEVLSKFYGLHI